MSPRRTRRRPDEPRRHERGPGASRARRGTAWRRPAAVGPERLESWPDGDWVVRLVPGAASAKSVPLPGM